MESAHYEVWTRDDDGDFDEHLARVFRCNAVGDVVGDANARLMADAPTMYELLVDLVASWSEDTPDPSAHAIRMEDARALVTKHRREAV